MSKDEILRVAALMTCHNRREKTLTCLEKLYSSAIPDGYALKVYLVDDASNDGTADAIRNKFFDVIILNGNGELFWNRGMIKAWEAAAKSSPNYYLWLNDDTALDSYAIKELIEASASQNHAAIIIGTTCSVQDPLVVTYGGRDSSGKLIRPNGALQSCSYFNGNCVIIPNVVYRKMGTLDPYYRHSFGDFDYGYRAKKAGIKMYVAPRLVGTCDAHDSLPKWCNPEVSLINRLKAFYSPLGCSPFEVFHLDKVRVNALIGLLHFFSTHLRVLAPCLWAHEKS